MKDMYNFEKNLKKKLDEAEFPFDEKNWEKASAMIDASRSNKKPFMFFMLSAIALLVTTGSIYFFYNSSLDNSSENILAVNNTSVEVKNVSENTVDLAEAKNTVNTESNEIQTANNASASEPAATLTLNKTIKTESHQKNHSASNGNSQPEITKNVSTETTNHNTSNNNNQSANNTTEKSSLKNASATNNPASANNTSNSKNTSNTEKSKNSTTKEIPVVLGNNTITNGTVKNTANNTPENANTNKLGNIVNPVVSNIKPVAVAPSRVTDSVPEVRTVAANTLMVNSVDSANKPTPLITDSSAMALSIAAPFQVKPTLNYLYAEVGASYLLGWNANTGLEGNGFNLVAGFNYQHYMNNNISAGFGLQYTTINNLTQSTYTVARVNYDFGVSKEITAIKYLQLHYVTVPVKLGLNVGKNNIIGVGANLSMLLIDEYRSENYHTKNAEPMNEKNQLSTKKGSGYLKGFNSYDVQVSAFYRRKLVKGFSINAEFGFGLMDVKDNAHFKNTNFERNTGGKLTLCYDLFKN